MTGDLRAGLRLVPWRWLVCMVLASAGVTTPVAAQDTTSLARQIRESQQRLEQIRAERSRLQTEMLNARVLVEDVSAELRNVERRLSASRGILAELDLQAEVTSLRVEESSRELLVTREQLRESEAVLNRRLRDIYKLGPLHSARVLLGADSFTDLLTRYRYLRLMANYDRGLVLRVGELEQALTLQNDDLQRSLQELGGLREAKLGEVVELRSVEQDRQATLNRYRTAERQTQSRLEELEADLNRLTDLVGDLETRRLEDETSAPSQPDRIIATDAGALEWPVEGEVLYNFGRQRQPNGTVLRWNGLGIQAPTGTPVRAVRGGQVVLVLSLRALARRGGARTRDRRAGRGKLPPGISITSTSTNGGTVSPNRLGVCATMTP